MRRIPPAVLMASLVAAVFCPAPSNGTSATREVVAFVGVDVAPLDKPGLLEDRTVLVRGDRITAIEPAGTLEVPEDAFVIDAKGKYLMPGLADMHVHVWCEGDLLLYVANGVTTARNMSGAPLQLGWRGKIAAGRMLGPTLLTTGPIINADAPPSRARVDNAAQAHEVVAEQDAAGYDYLKVYGGLSRESYDALLAAARQREIPVVGHVPRAVGLEYVLQAGQQSIEHLDPFGLALESAPAGDGANDFVRMVRAWEHGDMNRIPALARRTAEAGVWVCPTMSVFDARLAPAEVAAKLLARPEVRFVCPANLIDWKQTQGHAETYRSFRASEQNRRRLVKAIHDAGGRILLGTDTVNPFLIPGFSIHRELAHLVEAGLSPYEALRTGTVNAARFAGATDEFGAVAPGLRADLILVNANPLEDVRHVAERVGVMVRGRWLPEAELRRRLEDLAASYTRPSPEN